MPRCSSIRRCRCFIAIALLLAGGGGRASADTRGDAEARYDSTMHAAGPRAESLWVEANRLLGSDLHVQAVEAYGKLLEIAPGFAPAIRRRAGAMMFMRRRSEALVEIRKLALTDSSAYTLGSLAWVLVQSPDNTPAGTLPPAEDIEEATGLIRQVVKQIPDDVFAWRTYGEVANVNRDSSMIRISSLMLPRLAPGDWQSYIYVVMYALLHHDAAGAQRALDTGRRLGMSQDLVAQITTAIEAERSAESRTRSLLLAGAILVAWVAAFLLLLIVGMALSRATLAATRRSLSNPSGAAVGLDAWIRGLYRWVLWLCCGFFYASIPLVLAAVVVVGGGLIYIILRGGYVPFKLVAIIGIVTVVSLWSVVRSLFIQRHQGDPGERLDLAKQPKLRELLDQVASRIGTRPVDNVYMTPGTEIAVMERAGLGGQMRGHAERCLILGAGVLEGMSIRQLKSVLGHEYGHFSNRDTAGGGFALAVRQSLLTMAHNLARGGAATWYSPAWWFVSGFFRLFMRISQGASRLQEVLADRWAALAYGSRSFAEGLRHVMTASVRFQHHAEASINDALKEKRPLPNLYRFQPARDRQRDQDLVEAIDEALHAEAGPYDSHPATHDRLAWVEALHAEGEPVGGDDHEPAWSLFEGREGIEEQLTETVRDNIEARHGVTFAAADAAEAPG